MKNFLKKLVNAARVEYKNKTEYIPHLPSEDYFNSCLMSETRQSRLHNEFLQKVEKIKSKTDNDEKRWLLLVSNFFNYTFYNSIVKDTGFTGILKDVKHWFYERFIHIEDSVKPKPKQPKTNSTLDVVNAPIANVPRPEIIKMHKFRDLYKQSYDKQNLMTDKQNLDLFKKHLKDFYKLSDAHLEKIELPAIIVDGYISNTFEFSAEIEGIQHLPVDKK